MSTMNTVCVEITKIVKRELNPIDIDLRIARRLDGSTNSAFSINNRLRKCKQRDKNLERKKYKRPDGEGKESYSRKDSGGAVSGNCQRAEYFSSEGRSSRPTAGGSGTAITEQRIGEMARITRNSDAELLTERANGSSTTNLRVKLKSSRKNKGSKGSKEKDEANPWCWLGKTGNNDEHVPPSVRSLLEIPVDERSRRRLSDSLEDHSPSPVRRRSVSFDPITLFKTAILQNDTATVDSLLASGKVGPNTILDGTLPIVLASKDGCAECLEVLITKGARIDATDKQGLSSLELAVREGHFDCAQRLISAGANTNSIRDGYFDEGIESANRAELRSRSKTF